MRYGFDDVDDEETHTAPGRSQSFWGPTGAGRNLAAADQAIFVVGLMENDDGDPEAMRGIVKGIVGSSVLGSLSLSRPEKVAALKRDMGSAMGTPTGAPNFDDIVGTAELTFSNDELRRAQAGEAVSTSLQINGDGGRYELVFRAQASETPLVAFNPVDRFALTMGNRILVTTKSGSVFGHDLDGRTIGQAFRLEGPPVAFNDGDRFVLTMGNRILVTTKSGAVFGHDLDGHTIGNAFRLDGPPVAFNDGDRFVLTMGNRILVTTSSGAVFAHDVNGRTIGNAFRLEGPPVAFNPGDRFVLTMGNRILVITGSGAVFAHDLNGNTIGNAFQLEGPPVAFNAVDRFVLAMGNRILVTTRSGAVFGHDLSGNTIGNAFRL